MQSKIRLIVACLLFAMFVVPNFGPALRAQAAGVPTAEELDQLLAPVALYPDSLLSQITTASTNPQEILDAHNWLEANPELTGTALTDAAVKQGFDPAFIALVNFPQVLQMMAEHVDDYAAIGAAFTADQGEVTASIQRLRADASAAGTLQTTEQQQVEVQQPAPGQTVYVIQPANPQVVYVPLYDPTIVYIRPTVVAAPLITFSVGIGIGPLMVDQPWGWGGWGWNWGARRAYYNHVYWGGWANPYLPPHYYYRPRPVVYANRPGYRGNWGYRPPHYRPPYKPAPRPAPRPGTRPGTRPPAQPTKPGTRPSPRPGTPATPTRPTKPGTPTTPGTRPTRPGAPDRPSTQPAKPGNPSSPATRPARPTPPSGPSAQPAKPASPGSPSARPARPAPPNAPAAQPAKPASPTRPAPSRAPAPGQAKPSPSNRPAGGQTTPQKDAAPASRPQPDKPAQPKPAQKPEPAPQQ